jgi:hypothetical protein
VGKLLQIASALGIIGGLMTAAAAILYASLWVVLFVFRFVPVLGRRHRHDRWDALNKDGQGTCESRKPR